MAFIYIILGLNCKFLLFSRPMSWLYGSSFRRLEPRDPCIAIRESYTIVYRRPVMFSFALFLYSPIVGATAAYEIFMLLPAGLSFPLFLLILLASSFFFLLSFRHLFSPSTLGVAKNKNSFKYGFAGVFNDSVFCL